MELEALHGWAVTPREAVALQNALRERLVLRPPADLKVARIAGADISTEKGNDTGYGGFVILDAMSLVPLAQAGSAVTLPFPYFPGLLSFRELPVLAVAWARLARKPDLLIFDGPMPGHNPQMPVHYDLHVWLYRYNNSGLFAPWNPRLKCPAAE